MVSKARKREAKLEPVEGIPTYFKCHAICEETEEAKYEIGPSELPVDCAVWLKLVLYKPESDDLKFICKDAIARLQHERPGPDGCTVTAENQEHQISPPERPIQRISRTVTWLRY